MIRPSRQALQSQPAMGRAAGGSRGSDSSAGSYGHRLGQRLAGPVTGHARLDMVALSLILAASGCLNMLRLGQEGYANSYYAAAVKSMLQSWHNFFFVSFDPGGFVTIDKPPLGFWVQTASAKLFGFHGWSILLPQAVAGVLSVAVLFFVIRRVFGASAGLIAALALALSPISVATNRNNTIDSLLVLTVLLATWAVLKATEGGRLRWLLPGTALVGLGFNIKALEAFLVLPALGLVYLLAAPIGWRKRVLHLAAAGVVLAVVSLSWVAAVDLTPANQRPYVGSSQHNSELELALGYNGLQRFLGNGASTPQPLASAQQPAVQAAAAEGVAPAAIVPQITVSGPPGGPGRNGGPGGVNENGPVGVFRLLDAQLGGQISWLFPGAVIGLLASWQMGFRRPDRRHQSLIVWGVWLLTCTAFFSKALFFHRYYLSMLAPAVAALFGIGAVTLWQAYQKRSLRGWLLPPALLLMAGVQAYILRSYSGWNSWLTPIIVLPCVAAALLLFVARLPLRLRLPAQAVAGVTSLALLSLFVAPAVWSGDTVRNNAAAGGIPSAGPSIPGTRGFGGPPPGIAAGPRDDSDGGNGLPPGGGSFTGPGGPGGGNVKQLEPYLLANQGSTTFLVAVNGAGEAEQLILDTGRPVMAIGGFIGSDPILTAQSFATLVKQGTVRFVQLGGMGRGGQADISSWVQSSCVAVPASKLQSGPTSSAAVSTGAGNQQLYDCATAGA